MSENWRVETPEETARANARQSINWGILVSLLLRFVFFLALMLVLYAFLSWEPILTRTFLGWFNISAMISAINITILLFLVFSKRR